MKKTLGFALILTMLLAVIATSGILTLADSDYVAYGIKGTPSLGTTIDTKWETVPWNNIDLVKDGSDTEAYAKFKVMWDENKLYFLFDVHDETLTDMASGWSGDAVQLFLTKEKNTDSYGEGEGGVGVNIHGEYFDAANPIGEDKVVSYSTKHDNGYTVQCSVDLGIKFSEGKELGLEAQLDDCTEEGATNRAAAYGWCDDLNLAWNDSSVLGILKLVTEYNQTAKPSDTPTPSPTDTKTTAPTTNTETASTSKTPVSTPSSSAKVTDETDNSTTTIIICTVVALAVIGGTIAFIIIKKKK